ncbi:hypothetical protein RHECNPAF_122100136 [Rhizobium etli CNPAF512]|nr:hypothetical protein RHECNPAF_122100136 [Rhizobium etli CNPAF512]
MSVRTQSAARALCRNISCRRNSAGVHTTCVAAATCH